MAKRPSSRPSRLRVSQLTAGEDFFVDGRGFRVVAPNQHLVMQWLEARVVEEQSAAIHFLINLVEKHEPGFRHVTCKLKRPKKHQRYAISALRRADKLRKDLRNYGMPWGKGKPREGAKNAKRAKKGKA